MTGPDALQRVAIALRSQVQPAPADAVAAANALDELARAPRPHRDRLAARDAVIRAISEKFYVGQATWAAACAIAKGLSSYRSRAWLRVESDLHQNPDPSKIAGFFWEILKLVDEPIGDRQVYRILKNNRSD